MSRMTLSCLGMTWVLGLIGLWSCSATTPPPAAAPRTADPAEPAAAAAPRIDPLPLLRRAIQHHGGGHRMASVVGMHLKFKQSPGLTHSRQSTHGMARDNTRPMMATNHELRVAPPGRITARGGQLLQQCLGAVCTKRRGTAPPIPMTESEIAFLHRETSCLGPFVLMCAFHSKGLEVTRIDPVTGLVDIATQLGGPSLVSITVHEKTGRLYSTQRTVPGFKQRQDIFKDYRKVEGILFPFLITRTIGRQSSSIRYEQVQWVQGSPLPGDPLP